MNLNNSIYNKKSKLYSKMNYLNEISNLVSNILNIIVGEFNENLHKQFVGTIFVNSKVNFLIYKYFSHLDENERKIIFEFFNFYKNSNPYMIIFIDQFKVLYKDKKIEYTDSLNIINLTNVVITMFNYHFIENEYFVNMNKKIMINVLKMLFLCTYVIFSKDLEENKIIELVNVMFTLNQTDIKPVVASKKCFCF